MGGIAVCSAVTFADVVVFHECDALLWPAAVLAAPLAAQLQHVPQPPEAVLVVPVQDEVQANPGAKRCYRGRSAHRSKSHERHKRVVQDFGCALASPRQRAVVAESAARAQAPVARHVVGVEVGIGERRANPKGY